MGGPMTGQHRESSVVGRNTLFNLIGQGLPLIVALASIPLLTRGLGVERFGILALAWTFIGYFSVFDMGMGRSMTQMISDRLGRNETDEIAAISWTGIGLAFVLGLLGSTAIWFVAQPLVARFLEIPVELRPEALRAVRLLGLSLPLFLTTNGLRGFLEAHQRFGLVNALRAPVGAFTFLGPALLLPFTQRVDLVVTALVLVRAVSFAAHLYLCLRIAPILRRPKLAARGTRSELLRMGGWLTVSNVVSPILTHADRFLIGSVLSMSAVAFYTTPHEIVTKALVGPIAVAGVFFPAFAARFHKDPKRTAKLFTRSVRMTIALLVPVLLVLFAVAEPALEWWVGPAFAANGAIVVRWLTVGLVFNGLAQVPLALVYGMGRPRIVATFHLLEAPLYLATLWVLLGRFGIAGAAAAWSLRAAVDSALLFGASRRLIPATSEGVRLAALWGLASCLGMAISLWLVPYFGLAPVLLFAMSSFGLVAWGWLLEPSDRTRVRRWAGVAAGVCMAILIKSPGVAAQEAQPPRHPIALELESEEAQKYLRILTLSDSAAYRPWGIRAFGPSRWGDLADLAGRGPWASQLTSEVPSGFTLLRPSVTTATNTGFPFGTNDGVMWAGRGANTLVAAGFAYVRGILTVRVAPEMTWSQNADFELAETGNPRRPFQDPRWPRIDRPQRPHEGSFLRSAGGESGVWLSLDPVQIGFSSGVHRWGPAREYPVILGSNAGGFPALSVGTSRPSHVGIGLLEVRMVAGRLGQTQYSPSKSEDPRRLATALAITLTPNFAPYLELGATRFFHVPWDGGPSLQDVLRPFEGFIKSNLSDQERGSDSSDDVAENQLVSLFARVTTPSIGLETYLEVAREDHPWDVRDLIVSPDHDVAFAAGFQKLLSSGPSRRLVLSGELVSSRLDHLSRLRPQKPVGSHCCVQQGHTSVGQILGSPAAYGGAGTKLELSEYASNGRRSIWWERVSRDEGWTEDDVWTYDVQHSLGWDAVRFRDRWEFHTGVVATWNLNRNLRSDALNLTLRFGGLYSLGVHE